MGRRIIYATRTHEQVRQVLLEVENINRRAGKCFSAVNLANRKHLCLNKKCRSLSASEAMEACRLLKDDGGCPYNTEIELPRSLPLVLSIKELQRHGRARKICPYFMARKASEKCTVIVAPYQYVFNEHIRSQVKLELAKKILVFDEAHNADQIGQDIVRDILSEWTLNSAKQELETVNVSTEFIDDLTAYMERRISANPVTESGLSLREDLKQVLKVEKTSTFTAGYSDIVDEIRKQKMERGDYPVCFLNGVLNFIKHVYSSPSESYVTIYRKSFRGFNLLEYRCLEPSRAIKPVIEEAYGALIISGILSPLELFTEILGLEEAETRTYSAIVDPKNVRIIIDHHVTTRFAERGAKMTQLYGERISRRVTEIPNGVLIFFPQRRLMLDTLTTWRRMGLLEERETTLFLEENSCSWSDLGWKRTEELWKSTK